MMWALLLLAQGADSPYVRRDLEGLRTDWLAVAPPAFAYSLDALCAHRAKTLRVAVVRTDDVAAKYGAGAPGIAALVAAARPKFLLLAGDADAVPTAVRPSQYASPSFAGDADVATDHLFGAIAGRFPADTADELRSMAAKTVEYETALPAGAWQKKVAFVTGEGGFGELVDLILELQFSQAVTKGIPPAYDVEVAYAKPTSPYSTHPAKFNENTLRLINEGALFCAYVGHGQRRSFDDIRFKDASWPILEARDAAKVEVRAGLPVMVVLACHTGAFDSRAGDSIGEELFKRRRGPAAFIGGSRVTQPYGNALLGRRLLERLFDPAVRTAGEALQQAKEATLEKDESLFRRQCDAMAAMIQGPGSLEPMRKDVVLHYNLLGDPALEIRRPRCTLPIETLGIPGPGRRLAVSVGARRGPVEVTFECPRNRFCRPVDLGGDAPLEERLARRYAHANDKVIARAAAAERDGKFEAELELPKDLKPGRYVVKASSEEAIGALEIEVPE
jgi:hypothetical protein